MGSHVAFAQCTDEDLLRFKTRAQCWYSNQSENCSNLPLMTGTVAAASLAAKAQQSPEYRQLKKYLDAYKTVSADLGRDYKAVLRSYYDLKKASPQPTFDKPMSEFTFDEYKKFETQLKKLHPNNSFLQRFDQYGQGRANDIFQRTMTYAAEKSGVRISMDLYFNTAMRTMPYDLNKAGHIFRQVSIEKGYDQNGIADYDSDAAKMKQKIRKKEHAHAMKSDLKALQTGKVSLPVMGAMGVGAAALAPIADLNIKRAAIVNCAQKNQLSLQEREVLMWARAIELKGLLNRSENPCEQFEVTERGAELVFQELQTQPGSRQLMCALEKQTSAKQDSFDQDVDWEHESCLTKPEAGKTQATIKDQSTVIKTRHGIEVELKWNALDEWDYSSLKVVNNPGFQQYVSDKIRHPLAIRVLNSQHMNPRTLCQSKEAGTYPEALCEVSKAMRVVSQNKNIAMLACKKQNSDKINSPLRSDPNIQK